MQTTYLCGHTWNTGLNGSPEEQERLRKLVEHWSQTEECWSCKQEKLDGKFRDGDIVRHPHYPKSLFRLSRVLKGMASFEPVKKDGTRDRRWDVGFTGCLDKCGLYKREDDNATL
jgi:hypothetical protein